MTDISPEQLALTRKIAKRYRLEGPLGIEAIATAIIETTELAAKYIPVWTQEPEAAAALRKYEHLKGQP